MHVSGIHALELTLSLFFLISIWITVLFVLDLLAFRTFLSLPKVLLEIVPPDNRSRREHSTARLLTVLHKWYATRSFSERLLRRRKVFSLELVSTREQGIRYLIRVAQADAAGLQQALTSYLPGARIGVVEDYMSDAQRQGGQLFEFRLARHYSFPLNTSGGSPQVDPVLYIAGSLAQAHPDEMVAFQVVLTPASSDEAHRLFAKLAVSSDAGFTDPSWTMPAAGLLKLLRPLLRLVSEIVLVASGMVLQPDEPVATPEEAIGMRSKIYQDLLDQRLAKLAQPLFYADIRAYVVAEDKQQVHERAVGLLSALALLAYPGFQTLIMKHTPFLSSSLWWQHFQFVKFANRLPSLIGNHANLLSVDEVGNLFHFTHGEAGQAENAARSYSKTLPAPAVMKQRADYRAWDVVMGVNRHQGASTLIGLTVAERARHVYVLGGTGNGKTTLLEYAIVQDIQNGKGVALIDPHGDSAKRLLGYIPERRLADVIYLDPRDLQHPVGINMLELPPDLGADELAIQKDLVTEAVISVFRKVFDDESGANAYRIEGVLRSAIHTALTVDGATIFTVLRLLTDTPYRRRIVSQLEDPSLKRFWKEELGKAGEFQFVKLTAGVVSRIERFERSETVRRVLGQAKSTIDFDDILNSGKILICNFSKGGLGEDTSTLFGTTILAELQLATWRRDAVRESYRRPFYLYVDEFQNFASSSFMSLFSEARKYRLFVTIAQQSVSQLSEQTMLNTILDNVGTVIAFRSKSPETERILLHVLAPHVEQGEIGNLPSFSFYLKTTAVQPLEPMSGETIVLPGDPAHDIRAAQAVATSQARYGNAAVGFGNRALLAP